MILKLSNGETINLPMDYTIEERLELVNEVMAKYPSEFEYYSFDTKADFNKLTKIRLDVLASYLIRTDKNYTSDVMSNYKLKNRPHQEKSFSQFGSRYSDIDGNYIDVMLLTLSV